MTATEPSVALDTEAFCTREAYAATSTPWRSIWSSLQTQTPFLSHEWHDAWWRSLGAGTPEIVVVRTAHEAVAVAPFVRREDGAIFFSGDDLTDVLDILSPDRAGIRAVSRYLARSADVLRLRYVPDRALTLEVLPAALRDEGWRVDVEPLVVSPRVSLAASFERQLAALEKKDRHELRRKLRRVEKAARAEFGYVRPSELSAALDRFIAWHRRAPGEKAEFLTPGRERFFREIARAGAAAGWLRFGELRLDGRPIAALFAVEAAGTIAAYNSAVDPEATSLSPGIVLHAYAMRDAIARGLRTYDLLRGGEPYKYDLGARDLQLWQIVGRSEA